MGANQNSGEDSCNYYWQIQMSSEARIDSWLQDYFSDLSIRRGKEGTWLIRGILPDLPALYGLILLLRDAGIPLVSLHAEKEQGQNKNSYIRRRD